MQSVSNRPFRLAADAETELKPTGKTLPESRDCHTAGEQGPSAAAGWKFTD